MLVQSTGDDMEKVIQSKKGLSTFLLTVVGLLMTLVAFPVMAAQSLTSVTTSETGSGELQIVVEGTEPFSQAPASFSIDTPPRIVVDVEGASDLPSKTFPVGKSGVDSVVVVEANGRARLVARLDQKLPYNISTEGNKLLINIGQAGETVARAGDDAESGAADGGVEDSSAGRLSLNFQNIEVRSVLQLLADFTGLNMVVSDTVGGNITLRLKDVHWQQALDIILQTKGLSMRQTDNIIMVAPTTEIAAREQLEAEAALRMQELEPLKSELIRVKYATAQDLASLIKSESNQLLSGRGSVTVDQRTNTLLVRDIEENIANIRSLVGKLDRPIRQVLIEGRVVVANDDFSKEIGARFGIAGGDLFDPDLSNDSGNGAVIGGGYPVYDNEGNVVSNGGMMVNLPAVSAAARGGSFAFGARMGSYVLAMELTAMQQEGRGEIISSPRVVTSDQHTATIKTGTEIPYEEATSSGATNVTFKEAVLSLEVTPHITPDDRIIMDLVVKKDNPNFAETVRGVPSVDKREVDTSVLVKNGETVVLGGVFEEETITNEEKVPVLGDIPGLGRLFRTDLERADKRELLIFITPKILADLR